MKPRRILKDLEVSPVSSHTCNLTPSLKTPSTLLRPMPRLPIRLSVKPIFSNETASLSHFRTHHFNPGTPFLFPRETFASTIPAIQKWFEPIGPWPLSANALKLNEKYLVPKSEGVNVTVEVNGWDGQERRFERTVIPFDVFLGWISSRLNAEPDPKDGSTMWLYIAQQSLSDLPATLQGDLPTPEVVREAGKGDIYASSLWMGVPPTHTPLHKDPNPNLFVQMAGKKVVRMLSPDDGKRVFEAARMRISEIDKEVSRNDGAAWDGGWLGRGGGKIGSIGSAVRDEEMMVGMERVLTEEVVWEEENGGEKVEDVEGVEAELGPGDGLFIPKGWWHSIKGIREGVNASVSPLSAVQGMVF